MANISSSQRKRMASSSFGLPRVDKYVINTKSRAISAVAYAKKNARNGKISPTERDLILKKVHERYPSINITSTRGFKMR
jgi:nucleoside-triphosphatase THEP1